MRRLWAAAESRAVGRGGIALVARASGISRRAIRVGISELRRKPQGIPAVETRSRRKGGGRKKTLVKDPALLRDLENLVDPFTRGDPESALRWTCKSVRKLAEELQRQGHDVSHTLVAELLGGQKIVSRPIARPKRAHHTRTGMLSLSTSTRRRRNSYARGSPPFRSTPKRKSRSGITRMAVASGRPREDRKRFKYMILENKKMRLTASTIWGKTWAGSTWGRTMTPLLSPSRASDNGGIPWDDFAIPMPANY